jgi:hypothetical protein
MRRQVLVIWAVVTMLSVIDLLLCHRLGLRFHDWSRLALAGGGIIAGAAVALPALSATAAIHRPRAIARARTV